MGRNFFNWQRLRKYIFFIFLVFPGLTLAQEIKVLIFSDGDYFILHSSQDIVVIGRNKKYTLPGSNVYSLSWTKKYLRVRGKTIELPATITSPAQLQVNGIFYPGRLLVLAPKKLINVVELEEYLKGVVPKEVGPDWPLEALKAQAVVSRTYALKNINRHTSEGYNLCNKVHCQVYAGRQGANEQTDAAVSETTGEVLTENGELIQALFHGCCGGYTEEPDNVWDWSGKVSYLVAHPDPYCQNYIHSSWQTEISEARIRKQLRAAGFSVGRITDIEIVENNVSGRAKFFRIYSGKKKFLIKAARFRLLVDPWLIRSTKITGIVKSGDNFIWRGQGWGHGVGMCQAGAKTMAEQGYKYPDILRFYYPGAILEKR